MTTTQPTEDELAQAVGGLPNTDLPFPGFAPSGQYAIDAQAEQLRRLRGERDAADDRSAFYVACLMQLKAESQEAVGNLAAQLSSTRTQLADAEQKIEELKNAPVAADNGRRPARPLVVDADELKRA